jgi:hypothetical protein
MPTSYMVETSSKFISIGNSFINIQSIAHVEVDGNEITIHLIGGVQFYYSDETAESLINFFNNDSVLFT